ncbi:MAG: hypothetical protein AB7O49_15525 [Sphingomonadales bacterium]
MDEADLDAIRSAVARLRRDAGGSDHWTQAGSGAPCRGGFAWRDAQGNQFDVTISLFRAAPRTPAEREAQRVRDAWQTVMLGDDLACTGDPEAWRHAMRSRDAELRKKVGRP